VRTQGIVKAEKYKKGGETTGEAKKKYRDKKD
jgi:hypothetical protein